MKPAPKHVNTVTSSPDKQPVKRSGDDLGSEERLLKRQRELKQSLALSAAGSMATGPTAGKPSLDRTETLNPGTSATFSNRLSPDDAAAVGTSKQTDQSTKNHLASEKLHTNGQDAQPRRKLDDDAAFEELWGVQTSGPSRAPVHPISYANQSAISGVVTEDVGMVGHITPTIGSRGEQIQALERAIRAATDDQGLDGIWQALRSLLWAVTDPAQGAHYGDTVGEVAAEVKDLTVQWTERPERASLLPLITSILDHALLHSPRRS